ncbi:MAG: DNA repair protein RadA, partial [Campylobacter sp.]|nr:DNA repair protein RadA [Campylobacter sp.]
MAKVKSTLFECQHCGNQQTKWLGKCPDCGAFNSFVELKAEQIKTLKEISKITCDNPNLDAKAISEIKIEEISRIDCGDDELNLVLGGGIVEGSLVLIGGSPGIGKSTLLLKIASN